MIHVKYKSWYISYEPWRLRCIPHNIQPSSSVIGSLPLINPSPLALGKLPLTSDSGCICYTYTTGSSALPDIYAQALGPAALGCVHIYQAKHSSLWYKCYAPHYPCRLIARQYEVEIRIYYIDRLGKFDYGPAHANKNHKNHRYTNVCQQKWVNPMESMESSYMRLNSCFVAIALFHKVYYTSKRLTFFEASVSCFLKNGCGS